MAGETPAPRRVEYGASFVAQTTASYFTPDIRRTVGFSSTTIAMAAAMAMAAVMANRIGIVMDP